MTEFVIGVRKGEITYLTHPAKVQKDPAMGTNAAISPNDNIVTKTIAPTMAYAISIDAGPPVASDLPVPRKRPVPIVPPIAIIWTWRALSLRANLSAATGCEYVEFAALAWSMAVFSTSRGGGLGEVLWWMVEWGLVGEFILRGMFAQWPYRRYQVTKRCRNSNKKLCTYDEHKSR